MTEKNIGFEIKTLSNLIRQDIEKNAALRNSGHDNGVRGWAIDYFYFNRDKDIFQKDFEEKFQIRRSTASNILKLMEQNGYIRRESVTKDARLKKIVLTDKAVSAHNIIAKDIARREEQMRKGIEKHELEIFFKVAEQLKRNLED